MFGALGAPAVGWLADDVFGYVVTDDDDDDGGGEDGDDDHGGCSPRDARALGNGLFVFCGSTLAIAGLLYGLLHRTYPAERQAVARKGGAGAGACAAAAADADAVLLEDLPEDDEQRALVAR